MKFTTVGDPHLTLRSIQRMLRVFKQVEVLNQPVIWLGDCLHTKNIICGESLNAWFHYFATSKLNHWVLIGNHDYFTMSGKTGHSFEVFKALPNVTIIDEPTEIEKGKMWGMPFYRDRKEQAKVLKSLPSNIALFGHFEVKGFDWGTGYISKTGESLPIFKNFKIVVSGHFHKFQKKGNLVYLGTPYSQSFGEANQKKYIGIFDSETLTLDPQEMEGMPKHLSYDFNCNVGKVKSIVDVINEKGKHHLYRFRLIGTSEAIKNFPVASFRTLGVDIKFVSSKIIGNRAPKKKHEVVDSPKEQFKIWAEKNDEEEKLSKETVDRGIDVLEDVK